MASDMLPIPGICGAIVHVIWIVVFGALVGRYNILSEDCVLKTGARQGGIQLQVTWAWVFTADAAAGQALLKSMARQAAVRRAEVLQCAAVNVAAAFSAAPATKLRCYSGWL